MITAAEFRHGCCGQSTPLRNLLKSTRPAGILRNDWAENRLGNEPGHLARGYPRKSPDTGPGSVDGGVPVFWHWTLRPRLAFNHAVITGLTSRTPRTLSGALGDDFRDVRAVEFGPLVLRTIGHDFPPHGQRAFHVGRAVGDVRASQRKPR